MKVIITAPISPFCSSLVFEAEAAKINYSCQNVYSIFSVLRKYNFDTNCNKYDNSKAIETGMILMIMDMKKNLLCIFFIDLYSPRQENLLPLFYGS